MTNPTPSSYPPLPLSLKILAILFILQGAFAVLTTFIALSVHTCSLQLGVLGLFIGPGLLRLRKGWRTCALVFIWFDILFLPIWTILLLASNQQNVRFDFFGIPVGNVPTCLALATVPFFFVLSIWSYRVLTTPKTRELFGLTQTNDLPSNPNPSPPRTPQ